MVEALGLAGMCEVPLVVVEGQRGARHRAAHAHRTRRPSLCDQRLAGRVSRLVLAPGTIEEYFEAGGGPSTWPRSTRRRCCAGR